MDESKKTKKKNKIVLKRHDFWAAFYREIVYVIFHILFGYKRLDRLKIKKNENYLVLSNHQTDIDPILVGLSFSRNLYIISTDTLFNGSFTSKLLSYWFRPIPKKKGAVDLRCTREMLEVAKEKGSILIFAEGNRTIGEFQFDISEAYVKLIRKINLPIVFYNLNGGTGVSPRFAFKKRKGKFTGRIKTILKPEEYSLMSDTELLTYIKDNLRVYDSEFGELYKSNRRAEYLERILYVCPKCNSVSTLESNGNYLKCNNCNLSVEYTENLHFKSDDEDFKFTTMNEWYEYLKKWTREYEIPNDDTIIFSDEYAKVYSQNANEKRKLLSSGKVTLFKDKLIIGDYQIDIKNITIASYISGKKFNFSDENNRGYLVIGPDRFNALKYVFMFNKLDTYMKEKKIDKFYSID